MYYKIQWFKTVITILLCNLLVAPSVFSTNRIVSLDLCTDWMLIQYAKPRQDIIYSPLLYQNPPRWVPQGLVVHDGSLENILQLKPDTVLTGEFNAFTLRKRLQQLNVPVVVLPMPQSLSEILQYSASFASAVDSNPRLTNRAALPEFEHKQQTLLLIGANGIGTGRGTLEHEVIVASGLNNYLTDDGFISLDLENLVTDSPNHLLLTGQYRNSTSLANLFTQHPVIKPLINKQSELNLQSWRWQCPGPWTLKLVELLAGPLPQ